MFLILSGDRSITTLNVRSHSLDLVAEMVKVTHHLSGGQTARIGGDCDAKGIVAADFDLEAPPYLDPPRLIPGKPGFLLFFVSPERSIMVPVRIVRLLVQSSSETAVNFVFEAEMDSDLGNVTFHQLITPETRLIPGLPMPPAPVRLDPRVPFPFEPIPVLELLRIPGQ